MPSWEVDDGSPSASAKARAGQGEISGILVDATADSDDAARPSSPSRRLEQQLPNFTRASATPDYTASPLLATNASAKARTRLSVLQLELWGRHHLSPKKKSRVESRRARAACLSVEPLRLVRLAASLHSSTRTTTTTDQTSTSTPHARTHASVWPRTPKSSGLCDAVRHVFYV